MRVRFVPNTKSANPYLDLLGNGLARYGITVKSSLLPYPTPLWLVRQRRHVDVLHFQWLHTFYQRGTIVASVLGYCYLALLLEMAQRLDYRIVWTMHNLYPHERPFPELDVRVRRLILSYVQAVIVHCEAGRARLLDEFNYDGSIYVAPVGNYRTAYTPATDRAVARRELGLPSSNMIFLHVGTIRAYKGIPRLLECFAALPHAEVTLVIAGKEHHFSLEDHVRKELLQDQRVVLRPDPIPSSELPLYLAAADVIVAPFERVLTSSSIMLALSFGRPVVAPYLGCIPELVDSSSGFLYDPSDRRGLFEALQACTTADLDRLGSNAYDTAQRFTWDRAAEITKRAYTSK